MRHRATATGRGRGRGKRDATPADARARRLLLTKLVAGATVILLVNAALGLFAFGKQRQIGSFAVGLYDQAVVGMTHLDTARTAFARLVANRGGTQNPSADAALQADLAAAVAELDEVVQHAGSPRAMAEAMAARDRLVAFGRLETVDDLPFVFGDIDLSLADLARRTAEDGLRARDRVVAFITQSALFLAAWTGMTIAIVLVTCGLLDRAIGAQNATLARMAHMSRHDGLTGLLNRSAFHAALRHAVARARNGEPFAVLCLDLDRFKQVNDTLGHPVGDALLCAVSARLRALARETDAVARLGGDEFAVLLTPLDTPDRAAALARRVIEVLREAYDVADHRVVIGTTVGIALGDARTDDGDTLMRNADLALYRAKQEGRGIFRFFEPEMDERARARRRLEVDLRAAIEREEFELRYQPIISVEQRRIGRFEALIRWRHPTRGLLPPAEFVPLAEEIGLIGRIGAWALRTACREATEWPEQIGVAVNLSYAQFTRGNVADQVVAALRESGLAPSRLEVEISETALLSDTRRTLEALHALRGLGVRIAMDDFGTGYSSLSYLRSFPFDKLKIDQSFIRDLDRAGDSTAIIRAIVGMGESLGIKTTAEGVENEQQMRRLMGEGLTELQGFFFSRPCQASEVAKLLRDFQSKHVA